MFVLGDHRGLLEEHEEALQRRRAVRLATSTLPLLASLGAGEGMATRCTRRAGTRFVFDASDSGDLDAGQSQRRAEASAD